MKYFFINTLQVIGLESYSMVGIGITQDIQLSAKTS